MTSAVLRSHHLKNSKSHFRSLRGIARVIIGNIDKLKWNKNDKIFICGGIEEGIIPHLSEHYSNAKILTPLLNRGDGLSTLHPIYANAVEFYELAKGAYG